MQYNRKTAILAASLILTCALGAQAAGSAPTAQFYFKGWPYRQSTPCAPSSGAATECPTQAPDSSCSSGTGCPTPEASPTAQPVETNAPTNTPEPTTAPTVQPTTAPTVQPTAIPTQTPTTAPTAAPTKTPHVTQAPIVTTAPTQAPTVDDGDYTTGTLSAQEQIAYQLLNEDRTANGVAALALDSRLSELARMKSRDMSELGYFAHTSPTYGSAANMLHTYGYAFTSVGENIAHHATVTKAQAAFMSSDGHRRNILGSQWTKVGVGVWYDAQGFVYVTQLFVR